MVTFNYLAVLVASVAAFAVGALWYSALFGKQWRHLMHQVQGEHKGSMSMTNAMIGGFITTFVMVYVLAIMMSSTNVQTANDAVAFGLMVSVGFVAMTMMSGVFYEGRPWKLYFINASHYVVAFVVASLVLFFW